MSPKLHPAHPMHKSIEVLLVAFTCVACSGGPPPPPADPPPPAQDTAKDAGSDGDSGSEFVVEGGVLKLPGPVAFERGTDRLTAASDEQLDVVHRYLDERAEVTVLRIDVHVDEFPSVADNQRIAEKRALTIARWLVGSGIKCNRLLPVGIGATSGADGTGQHDGISFVNAVVGGTPVSSGAADRGGKAAGDPCH